MTAAPLRFQTQRRVEFRDTDAAGIVHFSAFFVYMEQAEHELLRSVGLSVLSNDDQGEITFPRISAACDFRKPARFEDLLDIEVTIETLGNRCIAYAFRFTRGSDTIATGSLTTACCRIRPGQAPQSIAIPAPFARRLRSRDGQRARAGGSPGERTQRSATVQAAENGFQDRS